MRQIKFRGLRTDGGGLVYGYYWFDNQNKKHKITSDLSDDNFRCYEVIPESVGQFTGLNDKNGVEIYEGDVVKFSTRRYHLGRDKGLQTITFKSDVIFDDGCFMISETQKYDTYLYTHSSECEIIGNTHTQDGGQEG